MNDMRPSDDVTPRWLGSGRRLRVMMLGRGTKPLVPETAATLRHTIQTHAEIVLTDFDGTRKLAAVDADLAIVLGGDGSILRVARQMGLEQVPVFGVNLGKLGFLAGLRPDEFATVFPEVCAGNCRIIRHLMFQCEVRTGDTLLASTLGLNETAVLGGPPYSMLDVDLYVDGELATTYSCDGLIVSTPVGSTAHSLSAGGPILRKDLQAFVISPISPHTLTVRPVVDTAERIYQIVVPTPHEATSVVVDGCLLRGLAAGDHVVVRRAVPHFQLVEVPGHGYYETLRQKLGWGGKFSK